MSLPLPPTVTDDHYANNDTTQPPVHDYKSENGLSIVSANYLSSDDRHEIFTVKAAERTHLLSYSPPPVEEEKEEERVNNLLHDNDDETTSALPLVDGCDIPGWRKEGLIVPFSDRASSTMLHSILNIGPGGGYAYVRKESQWPVVSPYLANSPWSALRDRLMIPPAKERDAICVWHDDVAVLVDCESESGGSSRTRFSVDFEEGNLPVKILGATRGWKAMEDGPGKWTFSNLHRRFRHVRWRFSDTHGEMIDLDTYFRYMHNIDGAILDDSPLGIYDSEFGDEDSPTVTLLKEYEAPSCFSPDLFSLVDEDVRRPPWRWVLMGPERSGTGLHIDPLWTNAWVTLIQGKKRWMLFPPSTPPHVVGMDEHLPQIPSAVWFRDYYPKVTCPDFPPEWTPVEVLQLPGETVFVPQGWMHLVLNLEMSVAVTHNYACEFGALRNIWEVVSLEESRFGNCWYEALKAKRRDLVDTLE